MGENPLISDSSKRYLQYIALSIFAITSIQLTFLSPYVVIVEGERANIFSGMLCACALLTALVSVRPGFIRIRPTEIAISVILSILAAASSAFSSTPASSGWRAFVIMSSGLGGYWTARLLLQSVFARKAFVYFCLGLMLCSSFLFFLAIIMGIEGYKFIDVGYHAISSRIMVMSFAPIALIASGIPAGIALGIAGLVIGYLTLIANLVWGNVSTGPVIPILMFLAGSIFLWKNKRLRKIFVSALVVTTVVAAAFSVAIVRDLPKDSQSVAYRIENIFFSAHIAMKHPLLGSGPFAPRLTYLDDYQITYPYLSKDRFKKMTEHVRTSENLPLTLIAEFGLPFALIYGAAIVIILIRMFRLTMNPPPGFYPHPLALLLPTLAMLMQFQIFDGIYHPQISWFFHILLGMCFLDHGRADVGAQPFI